MTPDLALAKAYKALGAASSDMRKAAVFISDKLVVSVCRRFKRDKRNRRDDLVVKVGAPNYLEAKFIRLCKRAGEPLPVRKMQLQRWPVKRKVYA